MSPYSLVRPTSPQFGTAVFLYGGWLFLAGGIRGPRDRPAGMMTLIALAISVAFSVAVTRGYPGEALWWELPTLVMIMLPTGLRANGLVSPDFGAPKETWCSCVLAQSPRRWRRPQRIRMARD